jgi:uncharacterized protein YjbJ (UPF0337 family)
MDQTEVLLVNRCAGIPVAVDYYKALKSYQRHTRRLTMAILNKDEVKGKFNQAKGTIKDKAGELTGNRRLEVEGEGEIAKGQTQEAWGETKRKVSNAVKDVADKINS